MSIVLKNEVRELRVRIEDLERKMNILSPEKRVIAGTPEPAPEKQKKRRTKSKSK